MHTPHAGNAGPDATTRAWVAAATLASPANMPTGAANIPATAIEMLAAVDKTHYMSLPNRVVTGVPGRGEHRCQGRQSYSRAWERIDTPSLCTFGTVGTLY